MVSHRIYSWNAGSDEKNKEKQIEYFYGRLGIMLLLFMKYANNRRKQYGIPTTRFKK